MVRAAAPLSAAKSGNPPRKPSVTRRLVVGVTLVYFIGLTAGLLFYRSIGTAPQPVKAGTAAAIIQGDQQIGRVFIVTPHACESGTFDNSKPGFSVSEIPCDQALKQIAPDPGPKSSADSRIRAIGRYFRGAD